MVSYFTFSATFSIWKIAKRHTHSLERGKNEALGDLAFDERMLFVSECVCAFRERLSWWSCTHAPRLFLSEKQGHGRPLANSLVTNRQVLTQGWKYCISHTQTMGGGHFFVTERVWVRPSSITKRITSNIPYKRRPQKFFAACWVFFRVKLNLLILIYIICICLYHLSHLLDVLILH